MLPLSAQAVLFGGLGEQAEDAVPASVDVVNPGSYEFQVKAVQLGRFSGGFGTQLGQSSWVVRQLDDMDGDKETFTKIEHTETRITSSELSSWT